MNPCSFRESSNFVAQSMDGYGCETPTMYSLRQHVNVHPCSIPRCKYDCACSNHTCCRADPNACFDTTDSRIKQRFSLSGFLIGHARSCAPPSRSKGSTPACLRVENKELIVTHPIVTIQPFCCTSGLHQTA